MPPLPNRPLEIILPGPGNVKAYYNPYSDTYTKRRDYALRMQRGYVRGIPQYEARGKPRYEARIRREQVIQTTGQTPWQRYTLTFEQKYGFSLSYWRSLQRRWVREINERSAPGGRITPAMLAKVRKDWNDGFRDPRHPEFDIWEDWMENRLDERLYDTIEYQDSGDKDPGRQNWVTRSAWQSGFTFKDVPPDELYFYH